MHLMFNFTPVSDAAMNGNVECARILLQTSQNDDRNAVNCVDELERFWTIWRYVEINVTSKQDIQADQRSFSTLGPASA